MLRRRPRLLTLVLAAVSVSVVASAARADTISQLTCTDVPCSSTRVPGIQTTTSRIPTFSLSFSGDDNGKAFLGVAIPGNGLSGAPTFQVTSSVVAGPINKELSTVPTFTSTQDALWQLGEKVDDTSANYSFATFASFSNQTVTSPAQYFLYDFLVGTSSNASTITTTLGFTNIDNGISRFPIGTIFFAFLEEGAEVKNVTPFDKNVMIVTSEPGTLSLLGLGLVSIGILVRRRMRHA